MMSWGQHLMFFLFIIIMSVYLQIPRLSRLAIIAALTANAVAELKFGQSIGFRHVLGFIVTVVTGNQTEICVYVSDHKSNPKDRKVLKEYIVLGIECFLELNSQVIKMIQNFRKIHVSID